MNAVTNMEYQTLSPWDRVQLARHPQRPRALDYIHGLCEDFVELHGDRRFGDDQAIIGGIATFDTQTILIIGHQKGRHTCENVQHNFGMAHPEGYRKALRLFQHAEKFGFPVLCLIDTPGANPNQDSEQRGQANAIAESIWTMAKLQTAIIACVIGEGGSGGALAIGVADTLFMLENAIYSVASPEAAASILWRDATKAPEAAQVMRITAPELHELHIVDQVIPEPPGGAHTDYVSTMTSLRRAIVDNLQELQELSMSALLSLRYAKYRAIGHYQDTAHYSLASVSGFAS
ncbi:MAG: acetyl-CoA carboxylase carboxyltransferase subunit alpha [Chloroflexi bacterium AL-W]|nr:acetyl-CoA carboxylase carboxyltransferase subunit alpha [Chloroflexi bacterium AL-N1]NOK70564.1 acetyl-CoA carboxylase carboxyltransferase subunit alpha [Chloroflexi bacterium AL-N10]NOK77556.1 acetyl-CoA carboxylase carboxyltransferase subunit alpha [Chloroflexi bacterium AL-N5]NOK84407.1 acetyl-CoA carboxylase carboxyltransferase subunit alpha [Chloroflexi bacterium AL-W]NOK92296.1 acetyl-CoA carboxylase carboxyltransferase subunit alpha [Chloroflexi bacterium AL-N15]